MDKKDTGYTHTLQYYSAEQKNEIMKYIWFIYIYQIYIWFLKYETNELSYKTEADSQIEKTNL